MFRSIKSDKDTYITNKYVDGIRAVSGNVGIAGSLDLFKLYGISFVGTGSNRIPQRELSRILLHFDLDPIRKLHESGKIDIDTNTEIERARLEEAITEAGYELK